MGHPYRNQTLHIVALLLLLAFVPGARIAAAQASGLIFDAEIEARRSPSQEEARLTLHTRVPFGGLSFLSLQEGFSAAYDIEVDVFEADEKGRPGELVLNRLIRREVPPIEEFNRTLSDTLYDISQHLLGSLRSGSYIMSVRVEDGNTRIVSSMQQPVEIPSYEGDVSMSSVMLLEQSRDPDVRVRPNVANVFDARDRRFIVSYDVYGRNSLPVRFSYDIYRLKGHGSKIRREEVPERSMEAVEERWLERGTNRVRSSISIGDLPLGMYVLGISVTDEACTELTGQWKPFEVRWTGLSEQISNLDRAIAQLEPIAKRSQLEEMQNAPTRQEKRTFFFEFWQKRDPTPRTERNERMEQFYYRTWYADEQFASAQEDGWQSDRGHVFLKFGEPDQTVAYPINARESFEIWTYENINRRFIFIDKDGAGRFVLLRPIWDKRNRIR